MIVQCIDIVFVTVQGADMYKGSELIVHKLLVWKYFPSQTSMKQSIDSELWSLLVSFFKCFEYILLVVFKFPDTFSNIIHGSVIIFFRRGIPIICKTMTIQMKFPGKHISIYRAAKKMPNQVLRSHITS